MQFFKQIAIKITTYIFFFIISQLNFVLVLKDPLEFTQL
jgi:hypothetical protein